MAFTMANIQNQKTIFRNIQIAPSGMPGMGDSQPPKNSRLISAHISQMAMYSPAMNSR